MTEESRFFNVLVIGDDPIEKMKKFDKNLHVEPYIKFRYLDAEKMQKSTIKVMTDFIKNQERLKLSDGVITYLKERVRAIASMKPFDYYRVITANMRYDENGNALSTENPNGKWAFCNHTPTDFAMPFTLKDGTKSFQAKKGDINWNVMHMYNTELYTITWDLIHGDREPQNKQEENIIENAKGMDGYYSRFKDGEELAAYSCSYWNYAVTDGEKWEDLDDHPDTMEWVKKFYNKFIKKLPDDTLLTIFECKANNNID